MLLNFSNTRAWLPAYRCITLLAFVSIIASTLSPYDFRFHISFMSSALTLFAPGKTPNSELEMLANALLFLPWGFAIAGGTARQKRATWKLAVAVFLASFGLSYAIEVLQSFLPTRSPSWIDVASNSIGGLSGFFLFYVWNQANISLACLAYGIIAVVASLIAQRTITLSNWDQNFPLLLGNELTGSRPWRGRVFEMFIADRAMSAQEVREAYLRKSVDVFMADSLLCLYGFKGGKNFSDQRGHLPPLEWTAGVQEARNEGALLRENQWLRTPIPVRALTGVLMKTSQFSLGVTLQSLEIDQRGPARIVSLSADSMRRNFTLGQDEGDLIFRLRTSFTGGNGTQSQLRAPAIFSNRETKHIVVTYNGTDLLVYENGLLHPNRLRLTPGVALFSYFFGRNTSRANLYTTLYYAVVFVPFGLLLSLALKRSIEKDALRVGLSGAVVVLFAFAMEAALKAVSGKSWQWEHLVLSISLGAAPVTLIELGLWFFRVRLQSRSAH